MSYTSYFDDYKCVEKTFPSFWLCISGLGVRVDQQTDIVNQFPRKGSRLCGRADEDGERMYPSQTFSSVKPLLHQSFHYNKSVLILVGMRNVGKTTLCAEIAKNNSSFKGGNEDTVKASTLCGVSHIDLDVEIDKYISCYFLDRKSVSHDAPELPVNLDSRNATPVFTGKFINLFIQERGFDEFRYIEESILGFILNKVECDDGSWVISTGGGVVEGLSSRLLLKEYMDKPGFIVVNLARPIHEIIALNTNDLHKPHYGKSIQEVFEARKELYEEVSHFTVPISSDISLREFSKILKIRIADLNNIKNCVSLPSYFVSMSLEDYSTDSAFRIIKEETDIIKRQTVCSNEGSMNCSVCPYFHKIFIEVRLDHLRNEILADETALLKNMAGARIASYEDVELIATLRTISEGGFFCLSCGENHTSKESCHEGSEFYTSPNSPLEKEVTTRKGLLNYWNTIKIVCRSIDVAIIDIERRWVSHSFDVYQREITTENIGESVIREQPRVIGSVYLPHMRPERPLPREKDPWKIPHSVMHILKNTNPHLKIILSSHFEFIPDLLFSSLLARKKEFCPLVYKRFLVPPVCRVIEKYVFSSSNDPRVSTGTTTCERLLLELSHLQPLMNNRSGYKTLGSIVICKEVLLTRILNTLLTPCCPHSGPKTDGGQISVSQLIKMRESLNFQPIRNHAAANTHTNASYRSTDGVAIPRIQMENGLPGIGLDQNVIVYKHSSSEHREECFSRPGYLSTKHESTSVGPLRLYEKQGIYILFGKNISGSPSPFIHNTLFLRDGRLRKYIIKECTSLHSIQQILTAPISTVRGAGITIPFKELVYIWFVESLEEDKKCANLNSYTDEEKCGTRSIVTRENVSPSKTGIGKKTSLDFNQPCSMRLDSEYEKKCFFSLTYIASRSKAVNTISRIEDDKFIYLEGHNTDVIALMEIMYGYLSGGQIPEPEFSITGKSVQRYMKSTYANCLVIGTGGAARAACCAAKELGFFIFVLGRDKKKAEMLTKQFNGESNLPDSVLEFNIVVNCIPIEAYESNSSLLESLLIEAYPANFQKTGTSDYEELDESSSDVTISVFESESIESNATMAEHHFPARGLLIEMIYKPSTTPVVSYFNSLFLLTESRIDKQLHAKGAQNEMNRYETHDQWTVVYGSEVLIRQALHQNIFWSRD